MLTREQRERLDSIQPNFVGIGEDEDPDAYDRWRDATIEAGGFGGWLMERDNDE